MLYEREMARKIREHERREKALKARLEEIRAELESESDELRLISEDEKKRREILSSERMAMARLRKADPESRSK